MLNRQILHKSHRQICLSSAIHHVTVSNSFVHLPKVAQVPFNSTTCYFFWHFSIPSDNVSYYYVCRLILFVYI